MFNITNACGVYLLKKRLLSFIFHVLIDFFQGMIHNYLR